MPDWEELREKFGVKFAAVAAGAFILCVVLGFSLFGFLTDKPLPDGTDRVYLKVKSGMNASDIGTALSNRGIINRGWEFC